MSFLRKLFGGGGSATASRPAFEAMEHDGFVIQPEPIADGGQFRLCAVISRDFEGETRTHRMIRADMFPDAAMAAEASVRKAKQMIAEQGVRLFN